MSNFTVDAMLLASLILQCINVSIHISLLCCCTHSHVEAYITLHVMLFLRCMEYVADSDSHMTDAFICGGSVLIYRSPLHMEVPITGLFTCGGSVHIWKFRSHLITVLYMGKSCHLNPQLKIHHISSLWTHTDFNNGLSVIGLPST